MSIKSGYCCKVKSVTGIEAIKAIGIGAHVTPSRKVMKNVAVKATIMVAIEMSSKISPLMSFSGNDTRKSCSAYLEVRIDKNINTEAVEVNKDTPFDMEKTTKEALFCRTGYPFSLIPPGNWKAAENTTVAIRVATRAHDSAVFFIHSSPFVLNLSCSSLNNA